MGTQKAAQEEDEEGEPNRVWYGAGSGLGWRTGNSFTELQTLTEGTCFLLEHLIEEKILHDIRSISAIFWSWRSYLK